MIDVNIVLDDNAIMPSYANLDDSGIDLFCKERTIVPASARGFLIKTGLRFELPQNFELQIRPKSGVSVNTHLRVVLGTVDSGYRGEIGIIIDNLSDEEITVYEGKAVAQAVLCCVPKMNINLVKALNETDRGQGGFGSTKRGI